MLYLENLSSTAMVEGPLPWEFQPATPIPDVIRTDKVMRDTWINRPDTKHYVYSGNEGVNANLRISTEKADGSGNPLHSSKFFFADYDRAMPEDMVQASALKLPFPPNKIEKSLSSNWRFGWGLEEPIIWPSPEFYVHFMKNFEEWAFNIECIPGLDKKAWCSPERLYTNSCDWRHIHDKPIPADVVRGWLMKASAKFGFEKQGLAIPLDVVKEELSKKYPRFADWPGDFTLGSQGPSFWVEGSESPKSAIVRETGIQTFSAHATKSFYTWAELLGADFVRTYEAQALGRAVKDIYHDKKHYYRQMPETGLWRPFEKGDIMNHLVVARDVSNKVGKDGKSMLSKAVDYVQSYQAIDGAAPLWARSTGVVELNGSKLLNIATGKLMRPAPGHGAIWGPTGQFPWLSNFFDTFFFTKDQLPYFLAELSHSYKHALDGAPRGGHAIFIVGGVNTGKTFTIRGVVGPINGGFSEAGRYLTGEDQFGSENFFKGIWTIDDGCISADPRTHKRFSEMVKRVVANQTYQYHEKFRVPCTVEWLGRVFISLNADEESLRFIPDLDISILDKICIFRTVDSRPVGFFPEPKALARILDAERAWFCRFLLEYKIPAHIVGDTRFGTIPYHDPTIIQRAQQSSSSAGFQEILEDWRDEYFKVRFTQKTSWEGNSFQLHKDILSQAGTEAAMRRFDVDAVGRQLSQLKVKGATYIEILDGKKGKSRKWKILRPSD